MIIIADSGSTKTAWVFTDGNTKEHLITSGVNPFFRNEENIIKEWKTTPINHIQEKVSHVFFYAAGVVNEPNREIIRKALQVFFPEAFISVQSDLMAAAQATLGNNSGIACILGTGSNSCLYQKGEIIAHVPPLGFILGDEGSGAVLGRQLVGDYLKKIMPAELRKLFQHRYPMEYGDFLNHIYRNEKPNMFLSGFVPFLKDNIRHEYCASMVESAFDLFVSRNVTQYLDYQLFNISFVGSVAYHFQEQLKVVFLKRKLTLGEILKEPLLNLMNYHLQR
jgi:glucosamine kinase